MPVKKSRTEKSTDPVLADQGGRNTASDPVTPTREDIIRQRAYSLYEQRGKCDGQALDDWLAAESQAKAS